MSRTTFALLLQKYLQGQATEAERQVVEDWFALIDERPQELSAAQWQALENRLWQKLESRALGIERTEVPIIPLWRRPFAVRRFGRVAAAAAVVGLLAFGYWRYQLSGPAEPTLSITSEPRTGLKQVVNHRPKAMAVPLEDGSTVWLEPESELQFPTHFTAGRRDVTLTGNAFFDVARNPDRPFYVKTGQIETKVLGTSFWVRADRRSPQVEVAVKTGKVSVYESAKTNLPKSTKQGNGIILTPNHRVTFFTENRLFVTSLVENPTVQPPPADTKAIRFQFDDTPLSAVLQRLETAYGIAIEVDKPDLATCPLTADLTSKSLYAQLDIITAAIQGTYEVKGTTILVSGKGCE